LSANESVAPTGLPRVGIAIVGAGGWGRNHVRNFATLSETELRFVVDTSEAIRNEVALAYPGVRTTASMSEAFADPAVQGVVIATPAQSHYAVARAALEAGKDVLVEKPLALETAHAEELVALARAQGCMLAVGHLLLYHPAVRRLREIVLAGELGEVLYVYAQRLNLGVVRRDENAWWSLAPHDIAVASYLLGAEPVAVSATGGTFLQTGRGIEDVVFATLHFADARLAHVHVSWLDPHKTRQITVVGAQKMAIFDDTSPDEKLKIFDKGVEPPPTLAYDEGVRIRTGDIRVPALRMQEPLRRECLAFVESIRTRIPCAADGVSGLGVVRTLEAGARSLAAGGVRVSVTR
jgi:predicted dehydrogenase